MSVLGRGFDLALGLFAVVVCGLTALFYGSRLLSPEAGGLLGVGVFLAGLALVVSGQVADRRLQRLAAGACPRCAAAIAPEHRHRSWQPEPGEWREPALSWDCEVCGFYHSERWACPSCQEQG